MTNANETDLRPACIIRPYLQITISEGHVNTVDTCHTVYSGLTEIPLSSCSSKGKCSMLKMSFLLVCHSIPGECPLLLDKMRSFLTRRCHWGEGGREGSAQAGSETRKRSPEEAVLLRVPHLFSNIVKLSKAWEWN